MKYRLGKKPARPGAIRFGILDYVDTSKLPVPPADFGHYNLVTTPWGMLGNEKFGDCVFAGAAHETMLYNAEAGRQVLFTETDALEDYAAVTGFKIGDPSTDQGTDVQQAADYRRKVGVRDSLGNRHKIAAYLRFDPNDPVQMAAAVYVCTAIGIGFEWPSSAEAQFDAGEPLRVVHGATIEGGHYTPLMGRKGGLWVLSCWGKLVMASAPFFGRYCDEAVAYVSDEMLGPKGLSLDGFGAAELAQDLKLLRAA